MWRSIFFLVVSNWFSLTEAENDDTSISLCSCGIPPSNSSSVPKYLRNVHHLYQLLDCLAVVAFAMRLESSRLPLHMISMR